MKIARMPLLLTLVVLSMFVLSPLQVTAQETKAKESSTTTLSFSLTASLKLQVPTNPDHEVTTDLELRTYYIGDLVAPKTIERKESLFETGEFELSDQERESLTNKDFEPIIDLIKNTIDSDSWEGQQAGSISPYSANLSMVVASTKSTHKKIQSLLTKLRELNDVTIKLETHLVVVDEASDLSGESFDAASTGAFKRNMQAMSDNALASLAFPAAVLFNGESITHSPEKLTEGRLGPLGLQMVITPDAKAVKLVCFKESNNTSESLGPLTSLQGPVPSAAKIGNQPAPGNTTTFRTVVEIPSRGYTSIDVTSMLENNTQSHKAILFVRPTISDRRQKRNDLKTR